MNPPPKDWRFYLKWFSIGIIFVSIIMLLQGCNVDRDYTPDISDCIKYFDGCNTCEISYEGLVSCTKKACSEYEEYRCIEYKGGVIEENQEPEPTDSGSSTGNAGCSANIFNCADFDSQSEAQAVFEACGGVGNDVHDPDRDEDGVACEALP